VRQTCSLVECECVTDLRCTDVLIFFFKKGTTS
jgi:hypothetical protein